MAITIDASKAKIAIKDDAKCEANVFFQKGGSTFAVTHLKNGFVPGISMANVSAGDAFTATATVPVSVPTSDLASLKKWNFGFIQFQKLTDLTLYYAGSSSNNGEVSIQAHIPNALAQNLGRDHRDDPNPPWLRMGTTGDLVWDAKTGLVTVKMGDHPMCSVATSLSNRQSASTNYLRRMIDSRTFYTIFSASDPDGKLQHLAHFKWTANWDYEFQWKSGNIDKATKTAGGTTSFKVETPVSGPPTAKELKAAWLSDPKSAPKLGTNEQNAALKVSIIGPPNRIDHATYFGSVPTNFWTP